MEVVRAQSVDVKNIMGCIFVVCIYGMSVRVYLCNRVFVYLCISAVFTSMECVPSERIRKQYSGLLTPPPRRQSKAQEDTPYKVVVLKFEDTPYKVVFLKFLLFGVLVFCSIFLSGS